MKLEPLISAKAKGNQRLSDGRGEKGPQISANLKSIDTRAEIAKAAGVSHDTIHKAKVISEKAPEATKEKLRRGDTTINKEYKAIVQAERKAEQIEAVRTTKLPEGKYNVIVADPPWSYDSRAAQGNIPRQSSDDWLSAVLLTRAIILSPAR